MTSAPTDTTTPTIEVLEYGEDGEDLRARGHLDLADFLAACDDYVRTTWFSGCQQGPEDAELPSGWENEPTHGWWRPVTPDDVRADLTRRNTEWVAAGWQPRPVDDDAVQRVWEYRTEELWRVPCDADHPDAEAWTQVTG